MKKVLIIFSIFLFVFAFAATVSAAEPEDLVGWWQFENNLNDSSINENDGTAMGGATYDVGQTGQALKLDGIDDYVGVLNPDSLDVTDYTFELWINANDFNNVYPTLLNRRAQSATAGYYWIWIKSNKIVLTYTDGTTARSASWLTSFKLNTWYHIALTKSGSSFTMYINGVSLSPKILDYEDAVDGNLFIGTYQGRTDARYNFNGLIDEVRIWDVVLNVEELSYYDQDNDWVYGEDDLCSATVADDPIVKLGVNRHIWYGDYENTKNFTTLIPGKKGLEAKEAPSQFNLAQTQGCSCKQILDSMSETTGFDFGGHYKYGCSKGLIEDWIAGEYYMGPTFVETVEVPGNSSAGISSSAPLETGKDYFLNISGIYRFANWGDYGIADAEYAYRNDSYALPLPSDGWTLGEDSYPSILGLDVQVDGNNVYWGDYNSAHTYTYAYAGTGNPVHFHVYDSSYGDNSGFLTVNIIEDKWVDLW